MTADGVEQGLIWHYTVQPMLERILRDGVIRRATAGLRPGERAAVWLSARPVWEPTATRWRRDASGAFRPSTAEEMTAIGYARIGVAATSVRTTWAQHRRFGGLLWADAEAIERSARQQGANPDEWRATYKDIARAQWCAVQTSADGLTWADS